MKLQYNRIDAGERIRKKRQLLNMTQDASADKIGISTKYFADIERGSCGMSIETLISIGTLFDMSLDYIIYGKIYDEEENRKHSDEFTAILSLMDNIPENKRQYTLRMMQLQMESWDLESRIQ